jgi:cell division protein DivIC
MALQENSPGKKKETPGRDRRMTKTRRRRRIRPGAVPWIIILCVIILWIGISFARVEYRNYKLRVKIESLQRELAAVEMRNQQLEEEIKNWQSPDYVERVAREELGLVKPGETVYILAQPLENAVEHDVERRSGTFVPLD